MCCSGCCTAEHDDFLEDCEPSADPTAVDEAVHELLEELAQKLEHYALLHPVESDRLEAAQAAEAVRKVMADLP